MISIAGTEINFLISMPTLKAYMNQFEEVRSQYTFTILDFKLIDTIDYIIRKIKEQPVFNILCLSSYTWNKERIEILMHAHLCKDIIVGGPDIPENCNPHDSSYTITKIEGEGEEKLFYSLMNYIPPKQTLAEKPSAYLTNSVNENVINDKSMCINIETMRGCNYRCAYCAYHKFLDHIEYRDRDVIVQEIEFLYKKGKTLGLILDSNFFANEQRAVYILDKLTDLNIHIKFDIEIIGSFITEPIVQSCNRYMRNGGDLLIATGIQSINKDVLKAINRPPYDEKVFNEKIKSIEKIGAMIRYDLIAGLPKETKSSYENSIDYVINLLRYDRSCPGFSILHIIPFTQIAKNVKELGFLINNIGVVLSTPTMSQEDIIECNKLNLIIRRLFDPSDIDNNRKEVRCLYFKLKDKYHISNVKLLTSIYKLVETEIFKKRSILNGIAESRLIWTRMRTEIPYDKLLNILENF